MEELVDAIAVFPEKRPGFIRKHRMPNPEEILLYCTSLVTRVGNGSGSSTQIRLAHFSVQEYLTSDRLHEDLANSLEEKSAKASIVEVCLSYLLSVDSDSNKEFPFANFAARTWPLHAAETSRDEKIHGMIVELLKSDLPLASHLISWPKATYDPSQSSLCCAAFLGLTRVVRDLLAVDDSARYTNEELYSALCYSARRGYKDTVRLLLHQGMKLDAHNSGQHALQQASEFGHNSVILFLLTNGADVKAANGNGETALHYAARNGHVDTISILLKEGANIEAATNPHLRTALHYAANFGHADAVSFLLSKSANHSIADTQGNTALHYALQYNSSRPTKAKVVSILLSNGASADFNVKHGMGKTALHSLAEGGHADVVSLLLSKGADHNITDNYGETPLHYAAERNHLDTAEILVSQGASLDAVDNCGRTPMGCAQEPLSGPFKGKLCVETIRYFEVVMKEREMAAKVGSSQA